MGKYQYRTPMTAQRKARRKVYQYLAGHRAAGNFRTAKLMRKILSSRGDTLFVGGYWDIQE